MGDPFTAVFITAVGGKLLKMAGDQIEKVAEFRQCLEQLVITVVEVRQKIEMMMRKNQFDEERPEMRELIKILNKGDILVHKCSNIESWDFLSKKRLTDKMREWDDRLTRFFIRTNWSNGEAMYDMQIASHNQPSERGSSSSSSNNNGAGDGDVDREVYDLKAAVPTRPVRHSERAPFTPLDDSILSKLAKMSLSGKAVAELEVMPFRDDESVPLFSKSMGGYGRTSLPEGLDFLRQGHPKRLGDVYTSNATLYADTQLVLTKFLCEVPLSFYVHSTHVNRCNREHMLLIERVTHENVAPLRAYYYSCRPTTLGQVALEITLVHDYYSKGSVSEMLHGKTKVPFGWDARLKVAIGVAKGIAFIHKQDDGKGSFSSFFHGDIKSSNIFLNANNYGCISDLGKSIAGYPNPYDTTHDVLRQSDVYNYGVLLLELITGNTPRFTYCGKSKRSTLVSEFRNFVGSLDQIYTKVGQFIRRKQWNPEAVGFQVLDHELLQHYSNQESQVQQMQMLWIAWICVSAGEPSIFDVVEEVKQVKGIGRLYD